MKGYLAWDDAFKERRPGILVVHEWWGYNTYVRKRAEILAELGYVALAIDMYGEGRQAQHPQDAAKFAGEVMKNLELMSARFSAAEEFLKQQPQTDGKKIGAIGYCFGGGVVLTMARKNAGLTAVASFHGSLAIPPITREGGMHAMVFIANGAADTFVTSEQIAALAGDLVKGGNYWQFISYPGVKHGFTNPESDMYAVKYKMPVAYNADADHDSWEQMKRFFARAFAENR
jgi:dienelactone hydrolase